MAAIRQRGYGTSGGGDHGPSCPGSHINLLLKIMMLRTTQLGLKNCFTDVPDRPGKFPLFIMINQDIFFLNGGDFVDYSIMSVDVSCPNLPFPLNLFALNNKFTVHL